MKRITEIEKFNNEITRFKLTPEINKLLKRIDNFREYRNKHSISDITLRNILMATKPGYGNTTIVKLLADYLYALDVIPFNGTVRYFEFKFEYIPPNYSFTELRKLDNLLSAYAGFNRYYKGLICIDINDWINNIEEDYFKKFLNYIYSNNDKILFVFTIFSNEKKHIKNIESVLSSYIRLDTININLPATNELLEIIEDRFRRNSGFYLTNDAKELLKDSINKLVTSKHFYGFKSIERLAEDILCNILETECINKEINAKILSGFDKDSSYIKRANLQLDTINRIGFTDRGYEND